MRLHPSLSALPFFLALTGCFEDSGTSNPNTDPRNVPALADWASTANLVLPNDTSIEAGTLGSRWDSVVNLSRFAVDSRNDLQRIVADWDSRTPTASGWTIVSIDSLSDRTSKTFLVRFSVDGILQGGLVQVPNSSKPLPVLLFGHPADEGINKAHLSVLGTVLGSFNDEAIIVAPAFRGEAASLGSLTVSSDPSNQSPWDRDVDDALAFLHASLQNIPQCDTSRIAAVGYSRGGGVVLLAALRDKRIASVAEISGPTDFFAPSLQTIALGLAAGNSYDLPGLDFLNTRYLQPFMNGEIPADSLRRVLLRRSAARFALSGRLPATLAIHGTADSTVNPDQSQALKSAARNVNYVPIKGMDHSSFVRGILTGDNTHAMAISNSLAPFLRSHL